MASKRELERRLAALGDIGAILGVMKNLTLMETAKLSRVLASQRGLVESLETIAADFLVFHPQPRPTPGDQFQVLLLVGSQRGFCGDFNDRLIASLATHSGEDASGRRIIAVGAKLVDRVTADLHMDGPHALEEIGQVIHGVMDSLSLLLSRADSGHSLRLVTLYHDPDSGHPVTKTLAPLDGQPQSADTPIFPPLLHIPPPAFFSLLAEQHLLAAMIELFHRSLMAESRFRLNHIEGASQRMERRSTELKRKQNLARQEEIIEEIEAILAGAGVGGTEAVDSPIPRRARRAE
jgi:F-type H+-transporting ATPase subunit gamma